MPRANAGTKSDFTSATSPEGSTAMPFVPNILGYQTRMANPFFKALEQHKVHQCAERCISHFTVLIFVADGNCNRMHKHRHGQPSKTKKLKHTNTHTQYIYIRLSRTQVLSGAGRIKSKSKVICESNSDCQTKMSTPLVWSMLGANPVVPPRLPGQTTGKPQPVITS